jgi:hypothetical protein
MLASGSEASAAGATVSAWGRGADSSAAGTEASSAVAMLGSSPSQDMFPTQYTIGGQPSTTTNLHVLLEKDFHLQA